MMSVFGTVSMILALLRKRLAVRHLSIVIMKHGRPYLVILGTHFKIIGV